ncbi:hypothetical protein T265_10627 [Opisthorchis viverrini]|uniref:Uncharacterized protein n=1 Tax=Opisthorchis viverrini TaxID=6198 RepID=A0A074Z1L2_OPIVI|nr:hypothetical protein T265_10627 [Opisthorchis viverrini]KER20941.1 hypothetical protein T265_10627 [Opisthorchis viverrini]
MALQNASEIPESYNRLRFIYEALYNSKARVLVRDYSVRHPMWTPGLILRRRGKVLYKIQVGPGKWIRHANQIRPTDAPILPTRPSELSLAMLLDTLDLGTIPGSQSVASSEAQFKHELQPRR